MRSIEEIAREAALSCDNIAAAFDVDEDEWVDMAQDIILAAIREAAGPLAEALGVIWNQGRGGYWPPYRAREIARAALAAFDGNERFSVRHARQALAAFDAETEEPK